MNFSHQLLLTVFYWILNDSKSPQVTTAVLVDLINVVGWMVSILPLISCSTSPLYKSLGAVTIAPTKIVIIIDSHVHV